MGRMSLIYLSSFICVGIEVVEPAVNTLCLHKKGQIVSGSYITDVFISGFLEELGQLVSDLGKVSLSDLTNKHWLPIDFVKDVINKGKESG